MKSDLPRVSLYEFAQALKRAEVSQRLVLPIPVLSEGEMRFGIVVNEMRLPWGRLSAAYPVRWRVHDFSDPEPVEPVEFTQKRELRAELSPNDPILIQRLLNETELYRTTVGERWEDARTPGFFGRVEAEVPEGYAALRFLEGEAPVRELHWLPKPLREKAKATASGLALPIEALSAADSLVEGPHAFIP